MALVSVLFMFQTPVGRKSKACVVAIEINQIILLLIHYGRK